jgi:hypothetical protein
LKANTLLGVGVLACILSCAQDVTPARAGLDLEQLLPAPAAPGEWVIAEGPSSFSSDSLWEYLNRGAPRYQAYGFERMVHSRYQLGNDPLSSVIVDVYDMGTELGAFGIYRSIRSPDADIRSWGVEGYRSGTVAAAWKGAVFVHAAADDDRPELIQKLELFVSGVCDGVAGGSSLPNILQPLPPGYLVPLSERYVASDLFGHAALPGGVLATYEIGGQRGELFFSELGDEAVAREALEAYRREKERWAEVSETSAGFRFKDAGAGTGTVLRTGHFVVGVYGDLPLDAQDDLLERLVKRLNHEYLPR